MKTKHLLIMFSLIFSINTHAKTSGTSGVGNGGDPVRDAYFSLGKNIIANYGSGLQAIREELLKNGITDYKNLANILSINTVHTTDSILKDNEGSVVSALGEVGSITLYVGADLPALSWNSILLDTAKSERLVIHEMLRASGVNDDNYVFTNIVLKDQGRITNDKFNFTWSKNNNALIASALANSFNSKDKNAELKFFRDAEEELISTNNLQYSELIKTYLQFVSDLEVSNLDQKQLLFLYRDTFRNLKDINSTVDLLKLQAINQDSTQAQSLVKYFVLSLKQIPMAMFQFKDLDNKVLLDYVQSLIKISNSVEYNSALPTLSASLSELELLIANNSTQEKIMQRTSLIVRTMQSLNK